MYRTLARRVLLLCRSVAKGVVRSLSQAFLLTQQWSHNVTHEIPGVMPHHEDVVSFVTRQDLDIFSPSNVPFANAEVAQRIAETGGTNLVQGVRNWLEDFGRVATGRPPVGTDNFIVGRDVAVTTGKVVYRNHLIELIQYAPTTKTVIAELVLIVPAWIVKYYILDRSSENSLARCLIEQGYMVFCISWPNPGARDGRLPPHGRHGCARCHQRHCAEPRDTCHWLPPGGTLLSIAAAEMARANDKRLASVLLAAQMDFAKPGELALFIHHSQMHFLDSMMWN